MLNICSAYLTDMTQTEEKVLVREIGKLGGIFGGGFGARFAAKRLPVEDCDASITIDADKEDVRTSLCEILEDVGKLTNEFASESAADLISVIMGSGHLNLNPTIVHVRLDEGLQGSTVLSVRAIAKEGLVKQHSARRAIENIGAHLRTRYAERIIGSERGAGSLQVD